MRYLVASLLCVFTLSLTAQVPSGIESCEYDPSGERWFVSCGASTLLSTSDLGQSWDYFGSANASHGMEVMNGALFVIHNNQVYAYDLNTAQLLGSESITGAGFLNGMGSDGNGTLVISDFSTGRILKIDASDPANMSTSTLVGNTGSTPNGVVVDVANGRAVVVNWGNNADILAINLETGELSTLVNESGLGNCDGIDMDSYGNFYISSWSPARITKYNSDFSTSVTVVSSGLSNPSDISFDEVNNMLGIANSGTNIVEFYLFEGCMDTTACNYDEVATQDDGSCLEDDDCGVCGGDNSTCSGCTDIESCNYNNEATLDDGSCEYPTDIFSQDYVDCDGICLNDADLDGVCDELDMCIGNYHDFCGICNGPGAIYECGCSDVPEGDCDCDGNVLDECGICGGGNTCVQVTNTISEIQEALVSGVVAVSGIVTGTNNSFSYFIQDGSGAWNGIHINDNTNLPSVGDEIIIEGVVGDYFGLTQLSNITYFETLSTGSNLPAAVDLGTGFIGETGEPYEGCLVRILNARCTTPDAGFGDGYFNDDSGDCLVDDVFFVPDPAWVQDEYYTITGILHYTYEEYKIEPRFSNDIIIGFCDYYDECGICNGPGAIYECGCVDMPDGDCDCDGNVLDECGICGGDGSYCIQTCLDDDDAVSAVGGCVNAVDVLGCAFYWNDILISELCPESCDNCPCDNDFNDNGVCDELEIYGCTYPDAMNYESLATADDGSCAYTSNPCPTDLDGNGSVGSPDLLIFLGAFGTDCE